MADVYNSSGSRVSRVDDDGTVYNSSGTKVGSADDDDGHVYNSSGSQVGRVDSSGTIYVGYDVESDSSRGYVGGDGSIYKGPRDPEYSGRQVGRVSSQTNDTFAGGAGVLLGLLN